MKKIIIAVIAILIAASIFVLINNSRTQQKSSSPISQNVGVATPTPDKNLETYTDDSGFAFQHDPGVLINKKALLNNLLYSSLELTSTGSADIITIKVEESSLNSVDDFFKGSVKTSVFGEIKKVHLAELEARQFESNNAKTTIALDQGVLFTITTNAKKNSLLSKSYDRIISSFVFVQPSQALQDSSSDETYYEPDVVEEEEVIE